MLVGAVVSVSPSAVITVAAMLSVGHQELLLPWRASFVTKTYLITQHIEEEKKLKNK